MSANTRIEELEQCPVCGTQWRGGDIFQHFLARSKVEGDYYYGKTVKEIYKVARSYGYRLKKPAYWSFLIGIEIRGQYDGVSRWQCPKCANQWCRFTNEKLTKEIV